MKYRRSRDESRERFFLNLEIHGKIRIFIYRRTAVSAVPFFVFYGKFKNSELRIESVFHCAAMVSGSECVVPAARFFFVRVPQAPLALLASHGVTEVKHLRCF